MGFNAGARVGSYEILGPLGAGGMGEVYLARDTKLHREVAIKILPQIFALDRERLARFEREAQILAALNHPNIGGIHGLDEHGDQKFLVLELVPGETLADRLARGAMPIDEAIQVARQLSLALEAAHDKGIVHRDLKPANIKITPDGTVKVLDFGLAKDLASSSAGLDVSASPTFTTQGTQLGVILGTAAYMSPEQARGKPVDKRADIWAFGGVVYEMLTGRAPFAGETITDILGAIVHKDVDWTAIPPDTPAGVRRLLRRCLQKDVKQRLRDIGDARLDLDESTTTDIVETKVAAVRTRAFGVWSLAIPFVTLVIGVAAGLSWRAAAPIEPDSWTGTRLGGPTTAYGPRISPDGQLLGFLAIVDGQSQIAVMRPESGNWTVLTRDRTHGLTDALSWAPDSSRIYYDRWTDVPVGIFSVPALGGEERLVLESAAAPHALPDGSLLVVRINAERRTQLNRFWPSTGKLESLPAAIAVSDGWAFMTSLPGGEDILFHGWPLSDREQASGLFRLNLRSGEMSRLPYDFPIADRQFQSLSVRPHDGSILIAAREGNLYRVLTMSSPSAVPAPILTFPMQPRVDAGRDGSLFLSLAERPIEVVRLDLSGRAERMAQSLVLHARGGMAPLPDGRVLVAGSIGGRSRVLVTASGKEPVALVETEEETAGPMTAVGAGRAALLIGTGAAKEIAIVSTAEGRIVRRLGPIGAEPTSLACSPDARTLYYAASGAIWSLSADGGKATKVGPGDSVTVDPQSGDLVVKLDEINRSRLVRIAATGGAEAPIGIQSEFRLVPVALTPGAIRDGRLLVPVASTDSWFWFVGLLDLKTGALRKAPVEYQTDFHFVTWSPPDGRVLGIGVGMRSDLWRFRPAQVAASR